MRRLILVLAAAAPACAPALATTSARRGDVNRLYQAALANPGDDAAFQAYVETLPKYRGAFVAEGDLLLNEQELRTALAQRAAAQPPVSGGELIVNTENGVPTFWKDPAARALTFAVDRSSFPDEAKYSLVVTNLKKAASDWQKACGNCGLTLTHRPEHDAAPSHDQVTFIARQVDAGGSFIAAAFFPNDAPADRFMDVDPSYYTTRFDGVGVFRHELGHVLGYRHEHTRGVPGCFFEDQAWQPLTAYDPHSVMHYFCGGGGDLRLRITSVDKKGHRALYKRP